MYYVSEHDHIPKLVFYFQLLSFNPLINHSTFIYRALNHSQSSWYTHKIKQTA